MKPEDGLEFNCDFESFPLSHTCFEELTTSLSIGHPKAGSSI
jgi:hypothetical protein